MPFSLCIYLVFKSKINKMYEKQTARLNYCEINEQISSRTQVNSSKTVFKKYA